MFLRPYTGLSDDGLVEMLNGNLHMQMFCGVLIDLSRLDRCLTDATCYESLLRYPTDVKLLWECCDWLHSLMAATCKSLKEKQPRNKFNDVAKTRLAYAKQRKPKKQATKKMLRRLLSLLCKLGSQ